MDFRGGANAPSLKRSTENAFRALDDMKELISEVEGADPRYEELREGARAAGKGYFEYAVSSFGVQDLTKLFGVLAQQRERSEESAGMDDKPEESDKSEVLEKDPNSDQVGLNPEILKKDAA